ncbi:MAG TPA: hypothetical protein VJ279_01685, partial [Hanamia sp.]|nr:hypothetical protein [Hanamia sp.]
RAGLAAIARFLKWIGLPVIDASIILMSFYFIKFLWSTFIKREVNYSPNMLIIAFPVFTLLFLASSYFSGLYDGGFKQSRLNKSTLIAVLVILSVYSLLPETLRFSRGILLFGSLTAFIIMTAIRWVLLKGKIIVSGAEDDETNQTIVVGSGEEFDEVNHLLEKSGKKERVLGRIETSESANGKAIGAFNNLAEIIKLYPVKEIIFCEGSLSFKTIIDTIPHVPHRVRIKFFANGSHTIIGSDDKDSSGEFISKEADYRLANAVYRRTKMLFDISISMLFLLSFPIHFILKKRPALFIKNTIHVLLRKKTWIGYAVYEEALPFIKAGIVTTTGLPSFLNRLPKESLYATDKLYAKHYHVLHDLSLIWKNYRFLS